MDGIEIDSLSPQEDEFALLALGVPSVYRGFMDPRRLRELAQWLELDSWAADRPGAWVGTWRMFLGRVAENRSGRLLLKSPNHLFRIRAIQGVFPDATFLWIVRKPEEIFRSNCKMWLAMFSLYALWDWEMPALEAFLCNAFKWAAQSLSELCEASPRERLVVIDFQQLTRAPVQTIAVANSRLCLGSWELMESAVERAAEINRSNRAAGHSERGLSAAAIDACKRLAEVQERALETHGL